jgi:hypothetical protein
VLQLFDIVSLKESQGTHLSSDEYLVVGILLPMQARVFVENACYVGLYNLRTNLYTNDDGRMIIRKGEGLQTALTVKSAEIRAAAKFFMEIKDAINPNV